MKPASLTSTKALVFSSCFAASVLTAQASTAFHLAVTMGLYLNDATTLLPVGNLVQLIWTPDDVIDHQPIAGHFDAEGYNAADEYLLFSGLTTLPGGWLGDLDGAVAYPFANPASMGNDPGDTVALPSGFVYGRVFDGPVGTDALDTFFHQTHLVAVQSENDARLPQLPEIVDYSYPVTGLPGLDGAHTLSSPIQHSALALEGTSVPEPGTFGFLVIGLALVGWRCRFAR